MKNTIKTTTYAITIGITMLAAAGTAVVLASADFAIAKGNNNQNNGNRQNAGGNNGNENANTRTNNGHSNGRTANSGFGVFNVAITNPSVSTHAPRNSRVGLIQAYEAAVIATSQAKHEYENAQLAINGFSNFDSDFNTVAKFTKAYKENSSGLGAELEYWQAVADFNLADSNLNSSREIENMALQLAANQETDEATIGRLWDMLGVASSD